MKRNQSIIKEKQTHLFRDCISQRLIHKTTLKETNRSLEFNHNLIMNRIMKIRKKVILKKTTRSISKNNKLITPLFLN